MAEFQTIHLLIALGGGILGAAFGALNAFILCGLASIIGTVISMVTGNPQFNLIVTWGPFLGPHVAFAGGIAASAYAARKGDLCSGRNVLIALFGFNSPSILLVGGLFGMLGYLLNWGLNLIPPIKAIPWTNTISLAIVINGILCRLMFGRSGLLGKIPDGLSRWRRSREEAWQPWPSDPLQVLFMGISVSVLAGYTVKMVPGSTGLFFGFAALSLVFFQFGAKIPVILHVALSAEMIVAATGNIGWGLSFGLIAIFLSELFACVFLIHGDTHIDPPAMSLVVTFSLYPLLVLLGWIHCPEAGTIAIACFIGIGGYVLFRHLRKQP